MHVSIPVLRRQLLGVYAGVIEVAAGAQNRSTETLYRRHLVLIRVLRNHDTHGDVEPASGVGDGLPVVPCAGSDDTRVVKVGVEGRQQVETATEPERASRQRILPFQTHVGVELGR